MAGAPKSSSRSSGRGGSSAGPRSGRGRAPAAQPLPLWLWRIARRWLIRLGLVVVALVLLFAIINPVRTPYMLAEGWRLGAVRHDWVDMDEIAPAMARSAVAAEDANFCLHWGFDMQAIRDAIDAGSRRGASTISQQVAKNVYLWQGRSWPRKAAEALLTPLIELTWSKRRILEVYLNVAEMGEGIFGVEAAAQHYFGVSAAQLSPVQAARLAVILPNPKARDAAHLSAGLRRRAEQVADGAATIAADGRADCFGE